MSRREADDATSTRFAAGDEQLVVEVDLRCGLALTAANPLVLTAANGFAGDTTVGTPGVGSTAALTLSGAGAISGTASLTVHAGAALSLVIAYHIAAKTAATVVNGDVTVGGIIYQRAHLPYLYFFTRRETDHALRLSRTDCKPGGSSSTLPAMATFANPSSISL